MDIEEKIRSNYYRSKLPYASSKKDPVVHKAYVNDENRLKDEFRSDLRGYIELFLGPITERQFGAFFDHAWSEGHSSGYYEIFSYTDTLIEFLTEFLKK